MEMIKKHPFISTFLGWLFLFLSFGWFQMDGDVTICYLSAMALSGAGAYVWAKKRERIRKVPKDKQKAPLYLLGAVGYAGIMMYTFFHVKSSPALHSRNEMVPFLFLTGALILYCIVLSIRKKWSVSRVILVILLFRAVLHLLVMMTGKYNLASWDMGRFFTNGDGHAGYIEYLYEHYFVPAQFDPREKWQYYHPPLHHLIEAFLLRLQTWCGVNLRVAVYNIQYPNLLYTMISLVCSYLIFREMKLRKLPLILATAVIAFSPAFFYVGILVNNDMLSVMFMLLSVLYTLRWRKCPTAKNILKIALCFGLGMLSKLSAALMAVPIAVIFLYALLGRLKEKEYRCFWRYCGQMAAFLAVAAPLSLYWSFRNLIRFGVPLGYVPPSPDPIQYIPEGTLQRLFDFSFGQLANPYQNCREYFNAFNEYNPLIALIKSSASDVGILRFILGDWPGYVTLWTTVAVAAAALVMMVWILFGKNPVKGIDRVFWGVMYAVFLVSYYHFCLQYPYECTEQIRYAMPLILIGALFLGLGTKKFHAKKAVTYGISGMVLAFSLSTTVVFISYSVISMLGMVL